MDIVLKRQNDRAQREMYAKLNQLQQSANGRNGVDRQSYADVDPSKIADNIRTSDMIRSTENKLKLNAMQKTRLDQYSLSVGQLNKISDNTYELLVNASSSSGMGADQIYSNAKSTLAQLEGILNSKINDNYSFSGSKVTTKPVSSLLVSNIVDDRITANYYNGDNYKKSVSVEGGNFEYGVNANHPAIKNLIASLHCILSSYDATSGSGTFKRDNIDSALDLMNTNRNEIANLQNPVLWALRALDVEKGNLEDLSLSLSQHYANNLNGTSFGKQHDAMIQVSETVRQLESLRSIMDLNQRINDNFMNSMRF